MDNSYTLQEFEVFKRNIYIRIQEYGQIGFIRKMLVSNVIEDYWNDSSLP